MPENLLLVLLKEFWENQMLKFSMYLVAVYLLVRIYKWVVTSVWADQPLLIARLIKKAALVALLFGLICAAMQNLTIFPVPPYTDPWRTIWHIVGVILTGFLIGGGPVLYYELTKKRGPPPTPAVNEPENVPARE